MTWAVLLQEKMADELGIGQDGISRLEKCSDLLISTLRGYVEAMGGKLRLVAEFPNRPPVMLSGLTTVEAGVLAATRGKGEKPSRKGRTTQRHRVRSVASP